MRAGRFTGRTARLVIGVALGTIVLGGVAHGGVANGAAADPGPDAATKLALAALPASPVTYGTPATFTATVRRVTERRDVPTGVVEFTVEGADIGFADVGPDGRASLTTPSLSAGAHDVRAFYNGDANSTPSERGITYTVDPAPTAIAIDPPAGSTVAYGAPIRVRLSAPRGVEPPQGTVYFGNVAAIPVRHGRAVLRHEPCAAGPDPCGFAIHFTPSDANHTYAENLFYNVLVAPATTTTTLTSTANPAAQGAAEYVVATVHPQYPGVPVSGTVTFADAGDDVATVPVDRKGVARLPLRSFGSGTHVFFATYSGDGNLQGSTSQGYGQGIV